MNKKMKAALALLMFIFGMSIIFNTNSYSQQIKQSETKDVTVSGNGTNCEQARQDALRNAVETVTGIYVASETLVSNFELVKDEIYTKASGFAVLKEVVSQKEENGNCKMTISATVSLQPLTEKLKSLGLLRQWKIMVMVSESGPGLTSGTNPSSETELIKQLSGAGYTLVDQNQVKAIKDSAVAIKAAKGDVVAAVELAGKFGADIIIVGQGTAELAAATSGDSYGGVSVSLKSVSARVEAKAILADTAEIIAVDGAEGKGIDAAEGMASKKALAQASGKLAKFFINEITKIPAALAANIQVVIGNVDFGTVADLEEAIKNLPNVKRVTQQDFGGSTVTFEVEYGSKYTTLATDLIKNESTKSFGLKVTSATKTKIVAEVK